MPKSIGELLSVLRKTTNKAEANLRLKAYVLGVDYPDQLLCLNKANPQAVGNVFLRRAFHVLADASDEEIIEIEQLSRTRNAGWLKPSNAIQWGNGGSWFLGPLFCYEEKVANVSHGACYSSPPGGDG